MMAHNHNPNSLEVKEAGSQILGQPVLRGKMMPLKTKTKFKKI